MSNATRSFKKKSTGIKPVIRVHQWLTKVFSHELTLIPLISSIYLFPFSIIPHATGFLVAPWFWVVVDLISPQTPQAHHRARHYRACGVRRELRLLRLRGPSATAVNRCNRKQSKSVVGSLSDCHDVMANLQIFQTFGTDAAETRLWSITNY